MEENKMELSGKKMELAWQLIRKNNLSRSEAIQLACTNVKLVEEMQKRIVRFYFRKTDGSVREAYGTLRQGILPEAMEEDRKINDDLLIYYDVQKRGYRSFRKVNLLSIE